MHGDNYVPHLKPLGQNARYFGIGPHVGLNKEHGAIFQEQGYPYGGDKY